MIAEKDSQVTPGTTTSTPTRMDPVTRVGDAVEQAERCEWTDPITEVVCPRDSVEAPSFASWVEDSSWDEPSHLCRVHWILRVCNERDLDDLSELLSDADPALAQKLASCREATWDILEEIRLKAKTHRLNPNSDNPLPSLKDDF